MITREKFLLNASALRLDSPVIFSLSCSSAFLLVCPALFLHSPEESLLLAKIFSSCFSYEHMRLEHRVRARARARIFNENAANGETFETYAVII